MQTEWPMGWEQVRDPVEREKWRAKREARPLADLPEWMLWDLTKWASWLREDPEPAPGGWPMTNGTDRHLRGARTLPLVRIGRTPRLSRVLRMEDAPVQPLDEVALWLGTSYVDVRRRMKKLGVHPFRFMAKEVTSPEVVERLTVALLKELRPAPFRDRTGEHLKVKARGDAWLQARRRSQSQPVESGANLRAARRAGRAGGVDGPPPEDAA